MCDMEKMGPTISFKVLDFTKQQYDILTKEQKKVLHHDLRITVAKHIHMAKINLSDYLGDEA